MKKAAKTVLIVCFTLIIIGAGGYFLVTKANAATPNDTIFQLDKLAESVARITFLNPQRKTAFEEIVLKERINELETEITEGEDIDSSLKEVEAQEENLGTALEEENEDTAQEAKATILEKYQEQVAQHLQTMEQVKTQVGNETAQQSIQKVIEKIQVKSQQRIQKLENINKGKNK